MVWLNTSGSKTSWQEVLHPEVFSQSILVSPLRHRSDLYKLRNVEVYVAGSIFAEVICLWFLCKLYGAIMARKTKTWRKTLFGINILSFQIHFLLFLWCWEASIAFSIYHDLDTIFALEYEIWKLGRPSEIGIKTLIYVCVADVERKSVWLLKPLFAQYLQTCKISRGPFSLLTLTRKQSFTWTFSTAFYSFIGL